MRIFSYKILFILFYFILLIITGASVVLEKHEGYVLLKCTILNEGEFQKTKLFNLLCSYSSF